MREEEKRAADERWLDVRRGWNRRGLRFALFLAIPLYPVFGLLDVVLLPEEWTSATMGMRLTISLIGAILLFLLDHPQVRVRFVPVSATYSIIAGLGLSFLISISGGFDSTYYSGLNLVMLAAGMLFVWPTRVSFLVYGLLVLSFFIPSFYLFTEDQITQAVTSTFFVVATAGLLLIAQGYRYKALRFESDAQLEVERLSAELQVANAHLEELARVDALTRVGNRRAFDERLGEEWSRTKRLGAEMAILMIDVDNFKVYNDRFGHPKGDDCLKRIAAAIREELARPGDFVARYGGEEFAIILPKTDTHGTERVAERVRRAVEELGLVHASGATFDVVTVSVGGVSTDSISFQTDDELVEAADAALYRAKKAGRNTTVVIVAGPVKLRESR